MPTKKLTGPKWDTKPCFSPEHNPPNMVAWRPGTYEHTCPVCGKTQVFTVPMITCATEKG